jgi:acetyl-CoA carboxylase/biotin carboxylase 1
MWRAVQLPEALQAKGVIFIGPNAAPMHALGDKIGATIIAQVRGAAGPCLRR